MPKLSRTSQNLYSRDSVITWFGSIVGAHRLCENSNSVFFFELASDAYIVLNISQSWSFSQIIKAYRLFSHDVYMHLIKPPPFESLLIRISRDYWLSSN